jgi:hypothetical protein
MARPERFELPTTKFVAWYSIQLSYGRFDHRFGGKTCFAQSARLDEGADYSLPRRIRQLLAATILRMTRQMSTSGRLSARPMQGNTHFAKRGTASVLLARTHVQDEAVVLDLVTVFRCHLMLKALDFGTRELDYLARLDIDHVIVVLAAIKLVDSLPALKIVLQNEPCRFELSQHPIHRGQSDVVLVLKQMTIDILGCHVLATQSLKNLEDAHARMCDLEANLA